MRNLFIGTLVLTCAIVFIGSKTVYARAQYKAAFQKAYPDLTKKLGKKVVSCAVCHPTKKKKERNDFGTAVGKAVFSKDVGGKKNEKDKDKLKKAIEAAVKEKSSTDGKTFGDLIKDGKLPGTEKVVKKDDTK
jgi:hypothetical protein